MSSSSVHYGKPVSRQTGGGEEKPRNLEEPQESRKSRRADRSGDVPDQTGLSGRATPPVSTADQRWENTVSSQAHKVDEGTRGRYTVSRGGYDESEPEKSEDPKVESEDSKAASEDSKLESEGSKVASEDAKSESEGSKVASEDAKPEPEGSKVASEDSKLESEDSKPQDSKLEDPKPEESKQESEDSSAA